LSVKATWILKIATTNIVLNCKMYQNFNKL